MNKVTVGNRQIIPTKIVCIGRNFVDHINELGNEIADEMVIFVKPNSSISAVLHAEHNEPLHYEGELCFLYEKGAFTSVGFGLDLTKRELQSKLKSKGLPWERAKAFNGSSLFSHFVAIPTSLENIEFELAINGTSTQLGNIELMIYKPSDILDEILSFMDLNDGDIVMTGTPKGVGPVRKGDIFVGSVKNTDEVIVSAEWHAQ